MVSEYVEMVLDVFLGGVEGVLLGCLLVGCLVVAWNVEEFTYYDASPTERYAVDAPVVDPWWKPAEKATLLTEETRRRQESIRNNALMSGLAYVFVYLSRIGFGQAWRNAQQRLQWFDEEVVR